LYTQKNFHLVFHILLTIKFLKTLKVTFRWDKVIPLKSFFWISVQNRLEVSVLNFQDFVLWPNLTRSTIRLFSFLNTSSLKWPIKLFFSSPNISVGVVLTNFQMNSFRRNNLSRFSISCVFTKMLNIQRFPTYQVSNNLSKKT
jgi:hypothetical protein